MMPKRILRFGKALAHESSKRVPYIVAIAFVIWLASAYVQFRKTTETANATKNNTVIIKRLNRHIVELSQQNQDLAIQNKHLSDRGIFYTKCVVQLFVTSTHPNTSVTLKNLTNCEFEANRSVE